MKNIINKNIVTNFMIYKQILLIKSNIDDDNITQATVKIIPGLNKSYIL